MRYSSSVQSKTPSKNSAVTASIDNWRCHRDDVKHVANHRQVQHQWSHRMHTRKKLHEIALEHPDAFRSCSRRTVALPLLKTNGPRTQIKTANLIGCHVGDPLEVRPLFHPFNPRIKAVSLVKDELEEQAGSTTNDILGCCKIPAPSRAVLAGCSKGSRANRGARYDNPC